MNETIITAAVINTIVMVIMSMVFLYVPKLNTWFAAHDKEYKQWFMLGIGLLVSIFIMASSCFQWWVWITCDKPGVMTLVYVFVTWIAGMTANQGVYNVLPQPKNVKVAKKPFTE
jgi:hypothetical protein